MSELRTLLDLPESVVKSAFVVQLTEGVRHPEALLRDYALTPDLLRAFDQSLAMVKTALDSCRSVASYIHGSFGSGKSHFMSVLSLMLSPDPDDATRVWADPALHALRVKQAWLQDKKLLRLHLHMVGTPTLEARLFPEYLARVQALHPEAVLPRLFADEGLFADAQALRLRVGDDDFFQTLNEGRRADPRWGGRAQVQLWTAERFDAARASADPAERQRLFDALVRTQFRSYLGTTHGYVGLDEGLAELSRHARGLGFDGVVFFFDEAVLWLASGASDRAWVAREMAKMAKLVESQQADRPAPLVSFLARQRDIVDLVGDQLAGGDLLALREAQRFWEGRFGTVSLPDRNLPAIVRKRIVRPRDAEAAARLEGAFESMRRKLGPAAWQTLLGDIGEGEEAFRAVYPFSPALIEVLVGMSAALQRERTALKVLMEILVEHLEDFTLGRLVPVGDLFDVLAGGEEPMDGVLRERFQAMRTKYQQELLPLVQLTHKTQTAEKCQRLRDDHPPQVGCSNCAEARCRADNRLLKTLLLASLLPNVSVLKELTVSRLVSLNHGTLRSTIPGTDVATAVTRLRDYAAQVGDLRVGDQRDPSVHLELSQVDVSAILHSAREHDKPGARKVKLRSLLCTAFGHAGQDLTEFVEKVEWRGTSREGSVLFGNVREMDASRFRVPPGHDFRIVIDYPFDEPGHTPQEDEARIATLARDLDERTVVWLPDFLSEALQADLGELVVLDAVLAPDALRSYLGDLRAADQQQAKQHMESKRSQKHNRVLRALEAAYGVATASDGVVDPSCTVGEHFHLLLPERRIPALSVNRLADAPTALAMALLKEAYPRHPEFAERAHKRSLTEAWKVFARLCEREGRSGPIDRAERRLAELCAAVNLLALREADAVVRDEVFAELERDLRRRGSEVGRVVSVESLRALLDPVGARGLTREVEDFLLLCYASWSGREVVRGDRVVDEPAPGALPGDAELVQPRLPGAELWERALQRAPTVLNLPRGATALRPRNVRRLAEEIARARKEAVEHGAQTLPSLLDARSVLLDAEAPRVLTAGEVSRLVKVLDVRDEVSRVEALASFVSGVSDAAMGRCLASMRSVCATLQDRLLWQSVESLGSDADGAARELVAQARRALSADEQTLALSREAEALRNGLLALRAAPQGGGGVQRPEPVPVAGPVPGREPVPGGLGGPVPVAGPVSGGVGGVVVTEGRAVTVADARAALEALRAELDAAPRDAELTLTWRLSRPR